MGSRNPKLAHGQARDGLQDHPVGVQGGHVGGVVGGRDLDHLEADDVGLVAEAPDDRKHLPGRESARLRRAGSGRVGGVEHVDVERDVEVLGAVERLRDGLFDDFLEPELLHLGHEVRAHALLAHPVDQLVVRVVPAQPHLHEVLARNVLVLDQPADGRAVRHVVAHQLLAAVRVSVEVDHSQLAGAVDVSAPRGVGPEDRVVAAQDDRHRARRRDLTDHLADRFDRLLDAERIHGGVAVVDHVEHAEGLDPNVEMVVHGRGRRQVALRGPDRHRAEARASLADAGVHRDADDGGVDLAGFQVLGGQADRQPHEAGDAGIGGLELVAVEVDRSRLSIRTRVIATGLPVVAEPLRHGAPPQPVWPARLPRIAMGEHA